MPELILALDAGTTNLRACVFTPGGDLLGQAASPVESRTPGPGMLEQDAQAIWDGMNAAIAHALAAAGRRATDLGAVGITSQRTSLVVWDRRTGQPLSPLVVWSDLRGAARAAELRDLGYPVAPQQAVAKLEGVMAGVAPGPHVAWGNIDAYLAFRLTGVSATDRSQAWPTGYLGLADLQWNDDLIAMQGLDPASFPTLVDTWGEIGMADVLGARVPLTAIVADQQAALIGHGGEERGGAKVTYGTSATVNVSTGAEFVYLGNAVPPFLLSCARGEARFCLEGMVYAAGSALDWARAAFGLGDHAAFAALVGSEARGAAFLPALQGLGAPHGDPARTGGLFGLTPVVGKPEIARAVIEGLAFRVREIVDHVFPAAGLPLPEVLRVDGGLTASEALMQAQADLTGLPVARHALTEATAAGAAICAGRGAGLLEDGAGFVRYDRTFEPAVGRGEADARFAAWRSAVHG